jgi:hypothetical protein
MEQKAKVTLSDKKIYWQNVLTEWELSGLSQAAFCRQRKITHSNFFMWRKRLMSEKIVSAPLLVPVAIKEEDTEARRVGQKVAGHSPIVLSLKNTLRIEVYADSDKAALRLVLDVLGVTRC